MRSILILDAFITDDEDEKLLNNFLDSSKSFGDDVIAEIKRLNEIINE